MLLNRMLLSSLRLRDSELKTPGYVQQPLGCVFVLPGVWFRVWGLGFRVLGVFVITTTSFTVCITPCAAKAPAHLGPNALRRFHIQSPDTANQNPET